MTDDSRPMTVADRRRSSVIRHSSSVIRGFTLIELLVVIIIIGILSALVMVGVIAAMRSAKRSSTGNLIQQIQGALDSYRTRWGDDPPSSLAAFRADLPNEVNNGAEALCGCISSQDRGGILFHASNEAETYGNIDADKARKNLCNWFFGDFQLREILDYYGQPLMYMHHNNYAKPTSSFTTYQLRKGGTSVQIKPYKTPATKAFAFPDRFQLFSAGPDGIPGNEDDVVGW